MRTRNPITTARLVLALLAALTLAGSGPATAQTPAVTDLFAFTAPAGVTPAALIQARDGNLYGTTTVGGNGAGTVFQLTPSGVLTTLYNFSPVDTSGYNAHGANPEALIQASDSNLYGTTQNGGANSDGTVFRMTPSGTLTTLYSFSGNDGADPIALIQARDGNLYGTTAESGAGNYGTVFKMTKAGKLTTLYAFTGYGDGAYPNGLIQARNGNLYGTTVFGGTAFYSGTVFKITTGGILTTLYTFFDGVEGAIPLAGLIQATDGKLYGTTYNGGPSGNGTVFQITTSGTLTTLYSFSGGSDGAYPSAGLIQATDGKLYGTTYNGGPSGNGTVFQITTSGTLTTLYSFSGSDGAGPATALIQAGDGNLYGTTGAGGKGGFGTVFHMTPSGTLTTLYTFLGKDGIYPAALIEATNGNLYGTTGSGGEGGFGTIFQMTPSGALTTLYPFSGGNDGAYPTALFQAHDGKLYGTTLQGGANDAGTVFQMTTSGTLTTLYAFSGGNDGVDPIALIQTRDGNLYGTTAGGGANNDGTIFKLTTAGALTTLYAFSGTDGVDPISLIQASDGNLYGTTSRGGNGDGTIFKLTTAGALTTLFTFTGGIPGIYPQALIQARDGNLYGTTYKSIQHSGKKGKKEPYSPYGTVFQITTSGTLTTLYSFNGGSDGAYPSAGLIQASDGNLYGTTGWGGNGFGTIFQITTTGALTSLYSFNGSDGSNPATALIQGIDGNLYSTTSSGGSGGMGVVYRLSGVNLAPDLTSISPTTCDAGRTSFTLTVKGSAFQTFSTIDWNGAPLATTYISPTELTASVPASLITTPGKAKVTVVNGTEGGASSAKTFTILTTTLKLKAASLSRDTSEDILTAIVTLSNAGFLSANSTVVKQATLNASPATNQPQSVGSIAAGSNGTATLVFPGSAGSSGQKVTLKVSGTFSGGTFGGSLNVTLP